MRAGLPPENLLLQTTPSEAALDIRGLQHLTMAASAMSRFYRESRCRTAASPAPENLSPRLGKAIPLSDAVPVLENFGFRVLAEIPTELQGRVQAHIHDCLLELSARCGRRFRAGARRHHPDVPLPKCWAASQRNDGLQSARLLFARAGNARGRVAAGLVSVVLRQTGVAFGPATVVDALRLAPESRPTALIKLFDSAHDPPDHSRASARSTATRGVRRRRLKDVRGIDDDRILRLMRAVVERDASGPTPLRPPRRRRSRSRSTASRYRGLPQPLLSREIWSTARASRASTCAAARSPAAALRWSDRRDDFRTEILGPDEGAAGQERGDRADRRQGRLLCRSSCLTRRRSRRLAG